MLDRAKEREREGIGRRGGKNQVADMAYYKKHHHVFKYMICHSFCFSSIFVIETKFIFLPYTFVPKQNTHTLSLSNFE